MVNHENPAASGSASEIELKRFNREGLRLWKALRAELSEYDIIYLSSNSIGHRNLLVSEFQCKPDHIHFK